MTFRGRGRGTYIQDYGQNYRQNYRGVLKTIIEMTLGEEIIERCKAIEVRIIEVDVETFIETIIETHTETTIEMTIEMTILEEVEVGLEKDNTHVTLEGMTEAVLDQDQGPDLVQEPVQIETA